MSLSDRFAGLSKILAAAVALLLVGALLLALGNRDGKRYLTVDFPQTNSLYKGSDVKILGVAVGRIEKLTPRGDVVRVKLSYEGDVRLPQDVKAVVVSPSIVGDRFVQLAPAFGGGEALKNNAFLPVSRTAVPVELDAIYKSLDDLAVALGPDGANKDGALSRLLDDTAGQIDGQGAQLNQTIRNYGKFSQTLSDNKDELFGSLQEVRDFVQLLNRNDATVRAFNDSTARVSTVLEGERLDLEATLRELSLALVDVNTLVKDNRGILRENVKNLRVFSQTLADRTDELEDITVNAPTALVNVSLAYNPKEGTLDTKNNLGEIESQVLDDPSFLLCKLTGEGEGGDLCSLLGGLFGSLPEPPGGGGGEPAPPELELPEGVPGLPRAAVVSNVQQPHRTIAQMLAVN